MEIVMSMRLLVILIFTASLNQVCFAAYDDLNVAKWGQIKGVLSDQGDLNTVLAAKQLSGNYITALTSEVSASGPGSAVATVNSISGSSAANIHSAELAANAATNANTISTIVKRDGSGNFSAGTGTFSGVVIGALSGVLHATSGVVSSALVNLASEVTGLLPFANMASIFYPDKYYVNVRAGNDTSGDGSEARPWLTLQKACTSVVGIASVSRPVSIIMSGGQNDSDSANPIVCPPNIILTSNTPIQVAHPISISSGVAGNDYLALYNIIVSSLTWTKNDGTFNTVEIENSSFTSAMTIKQSGPGNMIMTATNVNVTGWDTKLGVGGVGIISNPYWGGTISLEDAPSSSYYQIMGGYIYGAMTVSGGQLLYMSGVSFDVPAGATLAGATTGNGTPFIQSDNSSIPNVITGAYTLQPVTFTYQSASGSQPSCSAANRGLQWLVLGGAGVADIFQVCQKNAANAYVWTTH
jgi:hypothetical protein